MFDDILDPFAFGSWMENDIASDIIDFVNSHKYCYTTVSDVDNFLDSHHIDYRSLPTYLKDKIDELDLM